jgi:hypothetical protein
VADSLRELSAGARVLIRESDDPNDRWLYQKQIMVWDKKAAQEQASADELFASISSYQVSNKPELPKHPETIEVDTVIDDMTVYNYRVENPVGAYFENTEEKSSNDAAGSVAAKTAKSNKPNSASTSNPVKSSDEHGIFFLSSSPYSKDNPIPADQDLPGGAFYRIQLGAFSKPVDPDAFGGLSPITAETLSDRGLIRYYVGKFTSYLEAEKALGEVRKKGHSDAYLVSWYNGTKMTVDRVRKLEN